MADPLANASLIDKIDAWSYWRAIYYQLKGKNYLEELFLRQFQVCEMDSVKLDILFRLLKANSSPVLYEGLRPIITRIIEIASAKPEWFACELVHRNDSREIARLIVRADPGNIFNQRNGLIYALSNLRDNEVRKELEDLLSEVDNEKRAEVELLRKFMENPAANIDMIGDILDLCSIMGPANENATFDTLINWIIRDTDERKIKVLFGLMTRCNGAYHLEIIDSIAEEAFLKNQRPFISAIKDEPTWRFIILHMSYGLYRRDRDFKRSLSSLGQTALEMRIRYLLEFLKESVHYEDLGCGPAIPVVNWRIRPRGLEGADTDHLGPPLIEEPCPVVSTSVRQLE